MSEADKIRRISDEVSSEKKKQEEAESRKCTAEALRQRKEARDWFKKEGAAIYLKEIKKAAKEGERSLRIEIAGHRTRENQTHGNHLYDPYPHEILVLLEKFLIKEGFKFERFSQEVGWNAMYECREGPTHGGLLVKW